MPPFCVTIATDACTAILIGISGNRYGFLKEFTAISGNVYRYSAFHLLIQSPLPINSLSLETESDRTPDIVIRYADLNEALPADLVNTKVSRIIDSNHVVIVRPTIDFCIVRDGREVILRPAAHATEDDVVGFIQTTVMQLLMYQRGYFLLHGSAVDIDGSAVVFVARSTGGKSTLAAFMNTLGHSIIADDLVAIRIDGERMFVVPARPNLRLWPDAVTYVGKDVQQLPRVVSNAEKRVLEITHDTEYTEIPLRRIYVLGFGTSLELQPLGFQDGFHQLLRNMTFVVFYQHELEKFRDESQKLMNDCAKVATAIRVAQLQRPRSLELLPQIADMIVRDLEETP